MPRVAPITGKGDVAAEHQHVVDDVVGIFGQVRGPFSMLLHSPKLAERMLQFVKFNRNESVVEPRLLSHAILASVREREAAYVWAAQVGAARRNGVPEATIDILRARATPPRSARTNATSSPIRGSWCATTGSSRPCSTACSSATARRGWSS